MDAEAAAHVLMSMRGAPSRRCQKNKQAATRGHDAYTARVRMLDTTLATLRAEYVTLRSRLSETEARVAAHIHRG
jgi:hypothetical protein